MHLAALLVAFIACAAIIAIGGRFLLAPRQATLAFGVAADNVRALTEIKGVRDITSGVVLLVVWAAAGRAALGWALIAAALTPTADALIVLTNRGKLSVVLGIHGLTAALLIAAGLVLPWAEDRPQRPRARPMPPSRRKFLAYRAIREIRST